MTPSRSSQTRCFGPFRLLLTEQCLYEGTQRIRLGNRALEILIALTDRPGELIGKDELIARAWPNLHVSEGALRVHMVALRKALGTGDAGERYIANVASRGYRFVHSVSIEEDPVASASGSSDAPLPWMQDLPRPLARMIGRDDAADAIVAQLPRQRLLTIVGAGGIGKTTVAVSVADRLRSEYPNGIYFVDLAALAHSSVLPAAVAFALGMSNLSDDPSAGVIAWLRGKQLLLILDSCERVVEGAALLAERMLKAAPGVNILATSREPLRAEGERVLRLPPLRTPAASASLTAEQASAFPAMQLFAERASAIRDDFVLTDANALVVAEICRRLDGIALAIELVAGQVAAFDLHSLVTMLDDRFRLLARGRRTAMPRHQTMRAVIDWSYGTISDAERVVLRRVAVFGGMFDLAAAQAVVPDAGESSEDIIEAMANLVDKSLLSADVADDGARYRLLDTTRAYALERLIQSGEQNAVARRHAAHFLAVFTGATAGWTPGSSAVWLARYSREIGNVRSALDWAFSNDGDPGLGVALSAEAVSMMFELSLAEECRTRALQALSGLESLQSWDRRVEMRLRATLAAAMMYAPGPVPQTVATWDIVLQIATELGDPTTQARALWGLWTACIYHGAAKQALTFAEQFSRLHQNNDETGLRLGDRCVGVSLHYMGQQQAARDYLERVLREYVLALHNRYFLGFKIDHGLMTRATLARIAWIQGSPEQAVRYLEEALAGTLAQNHAISICYVISEAAIPILLMTGDHDAAARRLSMLEGLADQHGLVIWQAAARCLRCAVEATQSLPVLLNDFRAALADLRATGYTVHAAWMSGVVANAPGTLGDPKEKVALVDDALTEVELNGELWGIAELLRIKAELVALDGSPAAGRKAEEILSQALRIAHTQGARSWELRAAISLARMQPRQNQGSEARTLLSSVFSRFDEGFATADLLTAKRLLESGGRMTSPVRSAGAR